MNPNLTDYFPVLRLVRLLPTVCVVCGRNCSERYSLCRDCEAELPWIDRACFRCGQQFPTESLLDDRCARCLTDPPPFQQCQCLFNYRSPINSLLAHFKFHGRLEIGYALSCLLAERMRVCFTIAPKPDLLVPVPMHPGRLRRRGFNQALEVARVISQRCDIPVDNGLVVRGRFTEAQTTMQSARQRRLNLKNAFSVKRRIAGESVKSIAIIDDVVTTSSTVTELAKTLQHHGIRRIQVWSLARASD